MKQIYLDNAAATPIDKRVLKAMDKAALLFGNPSSYNNVGRSAREAIEAARKTVANFLGARPQEIIFTSSGSEANNLAILGTIKNFKAVVLTTPIEHPSVLEPLKHHKIKTRFLPISSEGIVDVGALGQMLTPDVILISVMYANNEIGTIQPIKKIAKVIAEHNKKNKTRVLFHVDACQAPGSLDMDVQRLGVDLLSFNGSKIYGPRGVGVLYVRSGTPLSGRIFGGNQERGLRAGTENAMAIIGLAKAVTLIKPKAQMIRLRDYTITVLKKTIPNVRFNGPGGKNRLSNNINICIPDLESEVLLLELDKYGIAAGSGSACTSHTVEPSHVLKAIGVPKNYINGALRFSLGRETTKADIDYVVKTLLKVVRDLKKRYKR